MPGRAFITADDFYLAAKSIDGLDEQRALRAIDAACEALERRCKRMFLAGEYTALHSGSRAVKDEQGRSLLYLADPATLHAVMPVTLVDSITEDGVALTVYKMPTDTAFATAGDCAVVYEHRGVIARGYVSNGELSFGAWEPGNANILCTVTAGYTDATAPDDLKALASELAWQYYQEGGRQGLEAWNVSDVGVRFSRLLTPQSKAVLDRYTYIRRPVTLEA